MAPITVVMSERTPIDDEECLAVWCAGEEWCSITCTMALIGNKWHPVIVDRLLEADALRFNELLEAVDGITNKVLSESLDDLEAKDLVDRTVVSDKPVRVEYALTDRGRSLRPVIDALDQWGITHLRPAASEEDSCC